MMKYYITTMVKLLNKEMYYNFFNNFYHIYNFIFFIFINKLHLINISILQAQYNLTQTTFKRYTHESYIFISY